MLQVAENTHNNYFVFLWGKSMVHKLLRIECETEPDKFICGKNIWNFT